MKLRVRIVAVDCRHLPTLVNLDVRSELVDFCCSERQSFRTTREFSQTKSAIGWLTGRYC